ncbi:hypothetical protein, partial [uncultured Duncaniella sp.]|uniref:hypothetical protein n=1 Tax=uncultured Duncaniella sp. TaxID=2768039 RepID=UPI00272BF304
YQRTDRYKDDHREDILRLFEIDFSHCYSFSKVLSMDIIEDELAILLELRCIALAARSILSAAFSILSAAASILATTSGNCLLPVFSALS